MLNGQTIRLRPLRDADLTTLYDVWSQVENRGEFYPHDILSESVFRKRYEDGWFWEENVRGVLLIVDHADHLIGQIEFFRAMYMDCFEIAYLVFDAQHRGKGVVTEAVGLLVKYLFQSTKVNRLQLVISTPNTASRRVAEKCGFTHEGTLRGAFFNAGRNHDMEMYSLLRSEFAS